jgi:hypothetical protein
VQEKRDARPLDETAFLLGLKTVRAVRKQIDLGRLGAVRAGKRTLLVTEDDRRRYLAGEPALRRRR